MSYMHTYKYTREPTAEDKLGFANCVSMKREVGGKVLYIDLIADILIRYKSIVCWELTMPNKVAQVCGGPNGTIRFNGKLEDGLEAFYFMNRLEVGMGRTQTNLKPYDQAVCECLLILYYFIESLELHSDGFVTNALGERQRVHHEIHNPDERSGGNWKMAMHEVYEHYGISYVPKITGLGSINEVPVVYWLPEVQFVDEDKEVLYNTDRFKEIT